MSWTICGGFRIDCDPAPQRRDGLSSMTSVSVLCGLRGRVAMRHVSVCRTVLWNLVRRFVLEKLLPPLPNGTINQMT